MSPTSRPRSQRASRRRPSDLLGRIRIAHARMSSREPIVFEPDAGADFRTNVSDSVARIQVRVLAARLAPELLKRRSLEIKEGAGNAGCALHPRPPVQQESTGVSNQGYTATAGIPCTMVLRLIRALPGDRAFCHRHLAGQMPARLSASVGAPGPHDFAVRCNINRPSMRRVHRIPLPTFVTTAKRPSLSGAGPLRFKFDLGSTRSRIFFSKGLDRFFAREAFLPVGQITVPV
jgi:hypothetical protein